MSQRLFYNNENYTAPAWYSLTLDYSSPSPTSMKLNLILSPGYSSCWLS